MVTHVKENNEVHKNQVNFLSAYLKISIGHTFAMNSRIARTTVRNLKEDMTGFLILQKAVRAAVRRRQDGH